VYDWYTAWKSAIVMYDSEAYLFSQDNGSALLYKCVKNWERTQNTLWITQSASKQLIFSYNWWTVSAIMTWKGANDDMKYLRTDVNYTTSYTPAYDWSPATKKYVDDAIASASWWMQLAPNSPLTPKYFWYWTQSQYEALSQYYTEEEWDTVYYTI
jgi:hypothetical protein